MRGSYLDRALGRLLIPKAISVINAFDLANEKGELTKVIEKLEPSGERLKNDVGAMRELLNRSERRTIFSNEELERK